MIYIFSSEYTSYLFHHYYSNSISKSNSNSNYSQFIKKISRRLANKNILYVKIFQAISLNTKFIDETINNELLKYTDNAPYDETDIDWKTIIDVIQEYNVKMTNMEPINSGMISLVFKMIKKDTNEPVIVKIKRKNIDEKLDTAIRKLMFVIRLFSFIPKCNLLNISQVVNNNLTLLKHQLNFEEEVQNTIEMKENCKHLLYVKIPEIYQEVTKRNANVIMMEYINGNNISQVEVGDYEQYAKLVLKYGFFSVCTAGISHGDLHSGNIIFIKNQINNQKQNDNKTNTTNKRPIYQIGLIDFGIVLRMEPQLKNAFLEIASELFTKPAYDIASELLDIMIEPKEVWKNISQIHKNNITMVASEIIDQTIHHSKDATQVKVYDFLTNFNNYIHNNKLHQYNLSVNNDFAKIQLSLAMSHGLSMCLCKDNYLAVANEVVNTMFHTDLLRN